MGTGQKTAMRKSTVQGIVLAAISVCLTMLARETPYL